MIIGLTGKAGCGKTSVAEYLAESYGFKAHALADPIKEMLCNLLCIDRRELEEEKVKNNTHPLLGVSIRYALQTLGTEWGRDLINPNLWSMITEQRILSDSDPKVHVISDVRFVNEAEMIFRNKGHLLYIDREDTEDRLNSHEEKSHASESFYDTLLKFYREKIIVIKNNDSLEDLFRATEVALWKLKVSMKKQSQGA